MAIRKTYGINGLLEWHGTVECNGVKMKLDFTNGSVTAYGVAPAMFTTSDALTQHIIENSEQFNSGRIRLIRSVNIPGTEQGRVLSQHTPDSAVVKNDGEAAAHETNEDEGENAGEGTDDEAGAKKVQVKVSSVEDVKDYLVDKFGIASSKLRTRAACIAAGEENGIEFVWE